jgi:hypothetical protein
LLGFVSLIPTYKTTGLRRSNLLQHHSTAVLNRLNPSSGHPVILLDHSTAVLNHPNPLPDHPAVLLDRSNVSQNHSSTVQNDSYLSRHHAEAGNNDGAQYFCHYSVVFCHDSIQIHHHS